MRFARVDQNPVARWWWTVDRWSLGALIVLLGFGAPKEPVRNMFKRNKQ